MIYGYYSSSMNSIPTELLLSEENRRGFPKEIPAMLIGRLAVSQSFQGKGIGKKLLRHGFECAVEVSDKIGINGIYVDAIDEQAKSYYLQFGFIPFNDNSNKLFLPIETIKKAIQLYR
jgi:predicted N-acetyltransferase YhbS